MVRRPTACAAGLSKADASTAAAPRDKMDNPFSRIPASFVPGQHRRPTAAARSGAGIR